MKKQIVIALILLISLTTITFNHKLNLPFFNLQKIIERSKKIALKLSNGVKFLLSKNKYNGRALISIFVVTILLTCL